MARYAQRKCLCCHDLFFPEPRSAGRQRIARLPLVGAQARQSDGVAGGRLRLPRKDESCGFIRVQFRVLWERACGRG